MTSGELRVTIATRPGFVSACVLWGLAVALRAPRFIGAGLRWLAFTRVRFGAAA